MKPDDARRVGSWHCSWALRRTTIYRPERPAQYHSRNESAIIVLDDRDREMNRM